MKMKWTKVATVALVVAMLCSMLASCAGGSTYPDRAGNSDVVDVLDKPDEVVIPYEGDETREPDDDEDPDTTPGDDNTPGGDDNTPGDDATPGGDDNTPGDDTTPGGDDNTPGDDTTPGGDDTTPGDDNSDPEGSEPPAEEKEWVKMEKENSGTAITFLAQNIRHDGSGKATKGDGVGLGVYNKMSRFRTMVKTHDADIIFYNEARSGNIQFMSEDPYFAQTYKLLWKYRWNEPGNSVLGGDQAEPLLYKTSRFKELDSGFIWLNDKQNAPGKSWDSDAAYGDINTWAKLQDKKTGVVFYAASVHTSPSGAEVCPKTMQIYYDRIKETSEDEYFFMGGDYNAYYRDMNTKSTRYSDMMMDWSIVCDLRDAAMFFNDDGLCTLGGMGSGHNYNYDADSKGYPTVVNPDVVGKGSQIDFLMAKPMANMAIDHYGFDYTVYDAPEDGVQKGQISDHWGLVVKMRIDTEPDYSQYYRDPYDYEAKGRDVWFNLTLKE